jgi:transposase-like protein
VEGGEGALSPARLEGELRDLRKRLKRTEQERDILKKALAIFSQPG